MNAIKATPISSSGVKIDGVKNEQSGGVKPGDGKTCCRDPTGGDCVLLSISHGENKVDC
jgi:hypothetical protein